MNDEILSLVEHAIDEVEPLIASVTPAQARGATPCPGLDLESLVAHLIGGLSSFADVADGKPLEFGDDPDLSTGDVGTTFRAAAGRVLSRFGEPGTLDRTFAVPWGETTGEQLLGFELIELVVHGWDIARSLGIDPDLDVDLVGATLAGARAWVDDDARVPQLFGPEVPVADTAPPLDQLVGFLGRDPGWAPR